MCENIKKFKINLYPNSIHCFLIKLFCRASALWSYLLWCRFGAPLQSNSVVLCSATVSVVEFWRKKFNGFRCCDLQHYTTCMHQSITNRLTLTHCNTGMLDLEVNNQEKASLQNILFRTDCILYKLNNFPSEKKICPSPTNNCKVIYL